MDRPKYCLLFRVLDRSRTVLRSKVIPDYVSKNDVCFIPWEDGWQDLVRVLEFGDSKKELKNVYVDTDGKVSMEGKKDNMKEEATLKKYKRHRNPDNDDVKNNYEDNNLILPKDIQVDEVFKKNIKEVKEPTSKANDKYELKKGSKVFISSKDIAFLVRFAQKSRLMVLYLLDAIMDFKTSNNSLATEERENDDAVSPLIREAINYYVVRNATPLLSEADTNKLINYYCYELSNFRKDQRKLDEAEKYKKKETNAS